MPDPIATTRAAADTAVTTAEAEAGEAAGLAQALEERVRDGDDTVTPDQIAAARELGHFAQLRADATSRKAAEAKRLARLAALAELKADIDAYEADNGDQAAQLIDTAYAALTAYVDHMQAHNRRLADWRQRMTELDVPQHANPLVPSEDHGHLGHHGTTVIAGNTAYRQGDPLAAVVTLAEATRYHHTGKPGALTAAADKVTAAKNGARIIRARTQVAPGRVYYRGTGGAILAYDPDKAPSAESIRDWQLTPVTEGEAYA